MKELKNLTGIEVLTKIEQRLIKGGIDQYHCYAPISKAECAVVGGKWNTTQNMCIVDIDSGLCA